MQLNNIQISSLAYKSEIIIIRFNLVSCIKSYVERCTFRIYFLFNNNDTTD